MALRAGYYGVKKSVLAAISNLSGAKIIKSIGDGLKLTSAGKLSCDIDADTMEFKAGKLSAKITSGFDREILWGNDEITYPPTKPSTIDLSEAYTDYDMIVVVTGFTSSGVNCFQPWYIPTPELEQCDVDPNADAAKLIPLPCNSGGTSGGQWVRVANHGEGFEALSFRYNGDVGVYKIIGLKF